MAEAGAFPAPCPVGVAAPAMGHFNLTTDWRLEGWCWRPDHPAERAQVEITLNGEVVQCLVASRFNEALRQSGIGDGRCGFSLSPPPQIGTAAGGEAVVEARERVSGTVLGRVIFHPERVMAGHDVLLTQLADRIDRCQAGLAPGAAEAGARIGRGLQDLGAALTAMGLQATGAPALAAERAALARLGRIDRRWSVDPGLSLILVAAADWRTTWAALRHAHHAMPDLDCEFILVDRAPASMNTLLQTRFQPLRVLRLHRGAVLADTLDDAAAAARGRLLCAVTEPRRLVAHGLPALVASLPGGLAVLPAAACLSQAAANATDVPGVDLLVSRAAYCAAGGLSGGARMADVSAGPDWSDFARRLQVLDMAILPASPGEAVDIMLHRTLA